MRKRSLTLLETLIALVLLVAMAALVVPSMLKSMEERTFESAADVTNDQLMMARAHAQATGTPVEVTYRPDRSQVLARIFKPGSVQQPLALRPDTRFADPKLSNLGPLSPQTSHEAIAGDDQSAITESWAVREISPDVRIVARPPAGADGSPGSNASSSLNETSPDDSFEELGKGEEIRLAVFMPDGSALVGEPVWLNDDHGRLGVLTINPWSGIPVFQRLGDSGKKTDENSRDPNTTSDTKENRDKNSSEREKSPRTNPRSDQSDSDSDFSADDPGPRRSGSRADDQ